MTRAQLAAAEAWVAVPRWDPRPACRCHADDNLYGALWICPKCGHRSFDFAAYSCERRKCDYAPESATAPSSPPATPDR